LDDLCTHENASHTAIVTRPASEIDIKYAVMLLASFAIIVFVIAKSRATTQSTLGDSDLDRIPAALIGRIRDGR
jgi:hypothetical protein